MEHPTSDIVRVYRAKVRGRLNESWLKSLKRGVMINGIKYKPLTAYVEKVIGEKTNLVHVECSEGKNHHVRNVFEHMNLYVSCAITTPCIALFLFTVLTLPCMASHWILVLCYFRH
jgi:23S rRNA pseudouridine2605 synthase